MRRWSRMATAVLVWSCPISAEETSGENPLAHLLFGATLEGYYEHNENNPHTGLNDLRSYDLHEDAHRRQLIHELEYYSILWTSLVLLAVFIHLISGSSLPLRRKELP